MIDYQKLISNLFNRSTQTINKLNINKQYIVGVFLVLYMRKGVLFFKNKENKLPSLLFILPYIGKTIKSKLYDETLKLERSINLNSKIRLNLNNESKGAKHVYTIKEMPDKSTENVLTRFDYMNSNRTQEKISGIIYSGDSYSTEINAVYNKYSKTNPLHADLYPEIRYMEIEVVNICKSLYKGSLFSCGSITSGGTESLLLTCLTYRDYCKYHHNITNPTIIGFKTIHPAFDKAAHYFNITIIKVNTLKEMRQKINSNCICIVGSAPDYPYGLIDPIREMAEIAKKYKVNFHVDACMGGFLIPFIDKFSYINFDLDGITSISMDTHKYGYSPKGSSVLLFSHLKYKKFQHFINKDWCGGVYATPTIQGSKPGGLIAATWATLLLRGRNNYVETSNRINSNLKYIVSTFNRSSTKNDLYIIGKPELNIIAFGSETLNIYLVINEMKKSGWTLSVMQNPPAFHFCLTEVHTEEMCSKFCADLDYATNTVSQIDTKNKNKNNKKMEGPLAIYGSENNMEKTTFIDEVIHDYIYLLSQENIAFRYFC
jgi:sphinganine-1-phosphate aldolase